MKVKKDKNKSLLKSIFSLRNILQVLVILTVCAQLYNRNYYNVFLCLQALLLFNIPSFIDRKLNIKMPSALEAIVLIFIFSGYVLGEIQNFYTKFPYWDTALHTVNGFIMAAIGFALVDILNQNPKINLNMSPYFVAFFAFCFSMTVGVLWEFVEFTGDIILENDMQKDMIVRSVSSIALNPARVNSAVHITNIQRTMIDGTVNGSRQICEIEGGYLDIGLADTMKDLIVNCVGAAVFSFIGFFYIKGRGSGTVAKHFIPVLKTKEKNESDEDGKE